MVPTGSQPVSCSSLICTPAPICLTSSKKPVRVGLSPTFVRRTAPRALSAASAMKNAADEGSPGTVISKACIDPRGDSEAVHPPVMISAPKARIMRSV